MFRAHDPHAGTVTTVGDRHLTVRLERPGGSRQPPNRSSYVIDRMEVRRAFTALGLAFAEFHADGTRTYVSLHAQRLVGSRAAEEAVWGSAQRLVERLMTVAGGPRELHDSVPTSDGALAIVGRRFGTFGGEAGAFVLLHSTESSTPYPPSARELLTSRELEVARLIASGRSTKEVAAALGISPHTARRHSEHIFAKLGIQSRVQLAATFR